MGKIESGQICIRLCACSFVQGPILEIILFHRQGKAVPSIHAKSFKNITRPLSPGQFLAEDKRRALVKKIRGLIALDELRYENLGARLIETMVNYCQSLPETANNYYSQPGGLMDFAL